MKRIFYSCALLISILSVSGCENNDLLLSEKKLNSKIQRDWKFVIPKADDGLNSEVWSFKDGKITLLITIGTVKRTYTGNYSVDARFSKAYVSLSGFTFNGQTDQSRVTADDLNRRWDLVELENPVFYLSTTNSRGTLQSLEFIEK